MVYIFMEYTYIVRYADKTYNVAKVNGQIEIQHAEVSAGYICTCNDKSISMRFAWDTLTDYNLHRYSV